MSLLSSEIIDIRSEPEHQAWLVRRANGGFNWRRGGAPARLDGRDLEGEQRVPLQVKRSSLPSP